MKEKNDVQWNVRVSKTDKLLVKEIAKRLNCTESDMWRNYIQHMAQQMRIDARQVAAGN